MKPTYKRIMIRKEIKEKALYIYNHIKV